MDTKQQLATMALVAARFDAEPIGCSIGHPGPQLHYTNDALEQIVEALELPIGRVETLGDRRHCGPCRRIMLDGIEVFALLPKQEAADAEASREVEAYRAGAWRD